MGLPRSDFTPGPTSATTPSPIDGEADIAIATATKKNAAVTTVRVAQPYRFVVGVEFESLRHPPRRDRGRGKTDAADAPTAARNTLSMPIARLRDRRGGQDQVVLPHHRPRAAQRRTPTRDQRAHRTGARPRPRYRRPPRVEPYPDPSDARLAPDEPNPLGRSTARAEALRLARRVVQLDVDLKTNRDQLTAIVTERAPELLAMPGVGAITAAIVLRVWSPPGRVRSEAALAQVARTCPIPASSGNTVRHRLNRGGDRRLNWVLNNVVLARIRTDPATRDYIARRTAAGKTSREI